MEYRQFAPPPELARRVECIWILRGAVAPAGQVILPDGRRELVFHFGERPNRQPAVLLTGQITEALELAAGSGRMDALGLRLRPEASGSIEEPGVWARRVWERAGNAVGDTARVRVVADAAVARLGGAAAPDAAVAHSIRLIEQAHGRGPVERFIPDALQVRQWQRRFAAAAGLSPKSFARIVRLQRVVRLYESGEWRRWADLALESGFYDQAHLANDFRAFSGQSPEAFFREGRGMAEFYRDAFFQDRATPRA